jgi:prefoldin subunit 5
MYLDEHYNFFKTYEAALAFIAEEAKKIADELDEMRSRATHLMNEAHDLLRNQASHLHITQ